MAGDVVFVGLMGSGKTTVGRRVAARLDRPFIDLDEAVEHAAGRSIAEVFEADGEAAFRDLEAEELRALIEYPEALVIAGGGGVILREENRKVLTGEDVTVIWLEAAPAFLASRIEKKAHRPLLAGDDAPLDVLERMLVDRAPLYREVADLSVDVAPFHRTEERPKDALADRIVRLIGKHERARAKAKAKAKAMITIEVAVPAGTYPVVVGRGAAAKLADVVPSSARRVAVVTQPDIGFDVDPGREHRRFEIAPGEGAKSLGTVEELCRAWAAWGLTRTDAVVAVGGGVVTDTAGFVAASYHRGVPVVHVPTTLLGMVDAAIGGKTGVNLPEGKNLVGAFWQPAAVLCDLDALDTLPERELRSGRGELAKYHFLTGADLLAMDLEARVAAAVQIKADVVASDEREDPSNRRGRATLNYGHTLAHALETAGRYDLRHGEAVAVGLVYAGELAHRLGRVDAARVARHRAVIADYGLDAGLPSTSDPDELVELMGRDKKALTGLTFVLDGPDGVEVVPDVDPADARAALEALT